MFLPNALKRRLARAFQAIGERFFEDCDTEVLPDTDTWRTPLLMQPVTPPPFLPPSLPPTLTEQAFHDMKKRPALVYWQNYRDEHEDPGQLTQRHRIVQTTDSMRRLAPQSLLPTLPPIPMPRRKKESDNFLL